MLLDAKELLAKKNQELLAKRQSLAVQPGLALIWVGDDLLTGVFVRVKKKKAQDLDCQFFLHQFSQASERQLLALISGLNTRKDIHGIVLQLPLPKNLNSKKLIAALDPAKDIDGLGENSPFIAPTPAGIISLLEANKINPATKQTVIIGAGPLVGAPLAKLFSQNSWPFTHLKSNAESQAATIRNADLLISCTGVPGLITPTMVHSNMIVVDGSGIDVPVKEIEPLVKMVTPAKGAIGPLTVTQLYANLLRSADELVSQSARKSR